MADYRPTRRQREQKAYNSLIVAGASGVGAIVALILSVNFGIVLLLAVIAAAAGWMFKNSVS